MSDDDLTVYEVLESSRDNPDAGPRKPADEPGMWVWWRTGPHSQGVWQAMDVNARAWAKAYRENHEEYPIVQDQALGEASDFGWVVCHSCGYSSEGYPDPGHMTDCDGVCKREGCTYHAEREPQVLKIYELVNTSHRENRFYQSVESAKAKAQEILDGYQKMSEEEAKEVQAAIAAGKDPEDEVLQMEKLTAPDGKLEWALEQHYLGGPKRSRKDAPLGKPVLTAHYSESSYFTIHEREVLE